MKKPELILVNLLNGDSMIFLNGTEIYGLESWEKGRFESPIPIAESIAEALGIELKTVDMEVPEREGWQWSEVFETLPIDHNDDVNDVVLAEHWDSQKYGGELRSAAAYNIRMSDQRATHGQVFLDVEPIEGHIDDNGLGVTVEVNNTPGIENSHVPCVRINLGNGNLAFTLFQDGLNRLILCLENGMRILSVEILPNHEHAYSVQEG